MTITPWHDHTDFEIAEHHNLDKEQIIDFHGKLLPIAGEFAGMHIADARPKIVEKLDKKGLLVSVDNSYLHSIAVNDRGKGIIEPQIKLQWFVDVNKRVVQWKGKQLSLKEVMQSVIKEGDIQILPERFNKTYFHWIDNLRDWCISRQIWWGHRIPVWYRVVDEQVETYVGTRPPKEDDNQGNVHWQQDPDTLDTWFSSALWTWSTLIDPKLADDFSLSIEEIMKRSSDYQTYHPTSVMETGWDILFFWVARMILATTYMTGTIPFKTVYLHGMVRAEDGQKMSKSRPETMIDPLDVIPKYGTDALRLALIHGVSPGSDMRMSMTKVISQRNFCNKLWNIARYIQEQTGDNSHHAFNPKTIVDHWILSQLQHTVNSVESDLKDYKFSEAYDKLYHFVWDDFADWYIEASKATLNSGLLTMAFEVILKIAHPFAPFVTEAIWQQLEWSDDLLILANWPSVIDGDSKLSSDFEDIKDIVVECRRLSQAIGLVKPTLVHSSRLISENSELVMRLAKLDDVKLVEQGKGLRLSGTLEGVWLDVDNKVVKDYINSLKDQQISQIKLIRNLEGRLNNANYIQRAPRAVVQQTKDQLVEVKSQHDQLVAELAKLNEL